MVCLQSEISRLLRSTKPMTNGEGAGPLQNHPLHCQWAYQPPFASKDTSTRSAQRDSGSKLDVGRISRVVGLKDNENHRPFPLVGRPPSLLASIQGKARQRFMNFTPEPLVEWRYEMRASLLSLQCDLISHTFFSLSIWCSFSLVQAGKRKRSCPICLLGLTSPPTISLL